MKQSSNYRVTVAALVVVLGLIATLGLTFTVLNPSPTQVSAPHSLTSLPEFAGTDQVMPSAFYTPPAGLPDDLAPGTVIKSEPIAGAPTGIKAFRILYVSQTNSGVNNVVSAMYAVRTTPAAAPNGRPLVSLAHGTTGNSPGCGVSMAPFQRGSTGFGTWDQLMSGLIGAGYAVVATDYANLEVTGTPDYISMNGEAHDVLNAARAAYQFDPGSLDKSQLALMGHSQGGHAALSSAYVAPEYAPDLSIKGTIAVAPALFPPAPLLKTFIQSGPDSQTDGYFLGFVSYVVNSWAANYPGQVKLSDVFTPKGVAAAQVGEQKCLKGTAQAFAGRKGDFVSAEIPNSLLAVAQQNFPIYEKYTQPLLIQQGLEDTTVVPAVNIAAARTFCLQGSNVKLQLYPSDVHSSVLYTGQPDALAWLSDRFAGLPAKSNCGGL
ncbi:MAG: hypothetical protein QG671_181 [Actinomycetota bacterium]|nr:hypothetical protein [Actinomycetota bacterium]